MCHLKNNLDLDVKSGPFSRAAPVFPGGGPQNGNPVVTANPVTARKKGDPQHMLREQPRLLINRPAPLVLMNDPPGE